MTVKVIKKGTKKLGKIVASGCCWWMEMGYLFKKD